MQVVFLQEESLPEVTHYGNVCSVQTTTKEGKGHEVRQNLSV